MMRNGWDRLRQWLARSRLIYYILVGVFLVLAPLSLAAFTGDDDDDSCLTDVFDGDCEEDCNFAASCAPSLSLSGGGDDLAPQSAQVTAADHYAEVWLEFGASGVFTPTASAHGVTLASAAGRASIPDELAAKGYLAIRAPHAPPAYTPSSLLPGVPPDEPEAIVFSYYAPPDAAALTEVAVPIVRRPEYEAVVNARYPIGDGRSHWEVWWLPEGAKFPIPDEVFRLDDGAWPPPLRVRFRLDFADAPAMACADCQAQVLLFNGYLFLGPYDIAVRYTELGYEGPLASFGAQCGYRNSDLTASLGQVIEPSEPLTHIVCLENWDTAARTFHITSSSSQGWDYTYYYQEAEEGSAPIAAPAGPFTVAVGAPQDDWSPGMIAILAEYTPGADVDTTLRETFDITATSVISPEVWAHTMAFAFGPDYQLDEEGGGEGAFLPLIVRRAP